jgi:hypothetical protein
MEYMDKNGNYNREAVLNGIQDIEGQIQKEMVKDVIDKSRLTRLRYEEALRGLYLWNQPYV